LSNKKVARPKLCHCYQVLELFLFPGQELKITWIKIKIETIQIQLLANRLSDFLIVTTPVILVILFF